MAEEGPTRDRGLGREGLGALSWDATESGDATKSGDATGRDETGRDETGRDETGRDETGRDETGTDEPVQEVTEGAPHGERRGRRAGSRSPRRPRRTGLLIAGGLLALVVVAAGVVIWQVAGGGDTVVRDDFTRRDSVTSLGSPWKVLSGVWGISDRAAYVARPSGNGSLAAVDMDSADGRVTASIPKVSEGAGIAFRIVDLRNYWMVVQAPQYATWNLITVVDGRASIVGNTGYLTLGANTGRKIAVQLDGDTIVVFLDDKQVARRSSSVLSDGSQAGLVLAGKSPDPSARWDGFSATGSG